MDNQLPRLGYRGRSVHKPMRKAPALDAFLTRINELGGSIDSWVYTNSDRPTLTLAATHDSVGPLAVDDNGDELTVEIGTKQHTHFSGYSFDSDSDQSRLLAAAKDAAAFVYDVTMDRVCFTVDYLHERCIGSSHFYLDNENTTADTVRDTCIGLRGGNIRSERYLWSGPVREHRTEP